MGEGRSQSPECDAGGWGGGGEGQGGWTGHELGGADGVLIVVTAEPVGGVVFLREVLEDLHERLWEDARGSPDGALRREEGAALTVGRETAAPNFEPPPRPTRRPRHYADEVICKGRRISDPGHRAVDPKKTSISVPEQ